MAYPNPYTDGRPQYSMDDYNPYEQPRYDSYDKGGPSYQNNYPPSKPNQPINNTPYTDESPVRDNEQYNNNSANVYRQNTQFSQRSISRSNRGGFEQDVFATPSSNIKDPIYTTNENPWTKGSRSRCIGRFCGCTLLVFILFFLSIVGALLLWIRPPAIIVGDIETEARDGAIVSIDATGLTVNLGINITVNNPNYFSVNLEKINADLFYPINNTAIGGGDATNVQFPSNTETLYHFPLMIEYILADDPTGAVLADLVLKCGSGSNITIKYKITVGIMILFIPISPVVENSVSFACPFDISDLSGMVGGS